MSELHGDEGVTYTVRHTEKQIEKRATAVEGSGLLVGDEGDECVFDSDVWEKAEKHTAD